jgi:small subunit ribosomal protein S9
MATVKKAVGIRATGRRKAAIATVILRPGTGKRTVNGREFADYMHSDTQQMVAELPFTTLNVGADWDATLTARGGGINGQVGAMRLAIARALVKVSEENRKPLRAKALLTRDPRAVERKKYGRKKARKRFQFSKR